MCNYVVIEEGKCKITKDICPYLYFCNKIKSYKPNASMPSNCKVKQSFEVPNGYYKVCFERKGNLYININGNVEVIPNPFDIVPLYVKATKLKSGKWRLKKYEG